MFDEEFENHWKSLPSYAEKDKEAYYKGWQASKQLFDSIKNTPKEYLPSDFSMQRNIDSQYKIKQVIHEPVSLSTEVPSYHDVVVIFDGVRYKVFDQPYSMLITCTRAGGWEFWENYQGAQTLLGGEFNAKPFRIEVNGIPIVDNQLREI